MGVEFIIYSKDGGCQQKELGDHGAVAGGDLMGIGDCQRGKRKADGSAKAADCYDIFYETWMAHM